MKRIKAIFSLLFADNYFLMVSANHQPDHLFGHAHCDRYFLRGVTKALNACESHINIPET